MNVAIVIIIFIVALFVTVSLHELGHFVTAKRAGVKIEEFGIGLPPRIFSIKRGEIIYSINAIPLGAFVKSTGENDPTIPRSLASRGPWARLLIYAAGPLANILLAFILLSGFFMLPTGVLIGNGVMVHSIVENSPAEEAGIEPGDIILEVNGNPVYNWGDMQNMVKSSDEGEEITLLLQRSHEPVSLMPEFDPALQRRTIGVLLCWNIVNRVEQNSPAYDVGIEPGDTILSINRQPVYNDESMSNALESIKEGEVTHLALFRGQEEIIKELDSAQQIEGMELRWVDNAHIEQKRFPAWKAIYLGGSYVINMPALIVDAIPLIKESPDKALVGPIGAGQLTVEFVKCFGLSKMLFMAGIISLGIALFNFIPIPPLDGGGMLIAFIEGVRRGKRLSPRAVHLAHTIGTALMIALMIAITFNDVLRLISGGSFML
jgi:Predicted membrane-associated Zn-dependent proteases 1